MSKFAKNTSVSSEKSRGEIESTLSRYGATGFMYGWSGANAIVAFEVHGRRIRFDLPMPAKDGKSILWTTHKPPRKRTQSQAAEAWEQACRQRWRALALVIKAKLEAVESGISVFEEEFLANIVLPGNQRVGTWMLPQIAEAYASGKMPPMLPAPPK